MKWHKRLTWDTLRSCISLMLTSNFALAFLYNSNPRNDSSSSLTKQTAISSETCLLINVINYHITPTDKPAYKQKHWKQVQVAVLLIISWKENNRKKYFECLFVFLSATCLIFYFFLESLDFIHLTFKNERFCVFFFLFFHKS